MNYGLYDTQDYLWIGTNQTGDGPLTFEEYDLARLAAQTVDVQLGWAPGRTRAKEYGGGRPKVRDEVQTRMSTVEALDAMEKGLV